MALAFELSRLAVPIASQSGEDSPHSKVAIPASRLILPNDPNCPVSSLNRGDLFSTRRLIVAAPRLEKPQKNPNRGALRQSWGPFSIFHRRATHSATVEA